jgi:hypothetical protein
MAIDLANSLDVDLGPEVALHQDIVLELIEPHQREEFDRILATEHYLHNSSAVGGVLRYVATCKGHWVALLVFASPALHIKARDRWLEWAPCEVPLRRHLIAQNTRFLIRVPAHKYPNLASRILGSIPKCPSHE